MLRHPVFAGALAALLSLGFTATAQAPAINFGDDSSPWAMDGECDDPRFTGPGMTTTTLLDADIMRDATDCRAAFMAGQLTLKPQAPRPQNASRINFGDDSSEWALDGECDDPRFTGPGMTTTTLLDADIMRDATDCRAAYMAGKLTLRP